ncbi:hypothetical protein FOA52_000532, partial [Chlamydomonas sp. UWO 241]
MTGFTLQLMFDTAYLAFVRVAPSALWGSIASDVAPSGTTAVVYASSVMRTGPESSYTGNSITLLDVYFTWQAGQTTDGVPVVSVNAQLFPFGGPPTVQVNDIRPDAQVGFGFMAGSSSPTLGVLVWASTPELFNTAVLDAADVTSTILAAVVSSFPANMSSVVVYTPDGCAIAGSNASTAAAAAFDVSPRACVVTARRTHTGAVRGALVNVLAANGMFGAQVRVSVWFPTQLKLLADDATLNRVPPVNAAQPPAGCTGRYQSTRLTLLATWIDDGGGVVAGVDVTPLAAFAAADPTALQVLGDTVRGLSPRTGVVVALQPYNQALSASTTIDVSDDAVCLSSLHTLAVSGVQVVASAGSSSNPTLGGTLSLSMTPVQVLTWEGDSALVRTVARFADGTLTDVTNDAGVQALALGGSGTTPFVLSAHPLTRAPVVTVTATVGTPLSCGAALRSSWSLCSSLAMGTANGALRIDLPLPVGLSLSVDKDTVTQAGDPAALLPISVPTAARLTVTVAFVGGSHRDFTRDARTVLRVSSGATLCSVGTGTDGSPVVTALRAAGSPDGPCVIEARVPFGASGASLAQPLTTTVSVRVVSLAGLQVLTQTGVVGTPNATNSAAPVATGPRLRLLQCGWDNYQSATLWMRASLSNCSGSGNSSCQEYELDAAGTGSLSLDGNSVASLVSNPMSPERMANVLRPTSPGTAILTASFGSSSVDVELSVEDVWDAGWPRVAGVNDTGFTLLASTAVASEVYVTVLPSAQLISLPSLPTAEQVVAAAVGVPMPQSDMEAPISGHTFYSQDFTGLLPATNYSVLVAVVYGGQRVPTVVAITGILTPDTKAPTFAVLGPTSGPVISAAASSGTSGGSLALSLPVRMDKAGEVSFTLFRNSSCIVGAPNLAEVVAGSTLPRPRCTCVPTSDCAPLASGSLNTALDAAGGGGGAYAGLLSLTASLPPSPFEYLRGSSVSGLTCGRAGAVPSYLPPQYDLYLVAQGALPNYRGWALDCRPPLPGALLPGAGAAECAPIAIASCTATPPQFPQRNEQAAGTGVYGE